MCKNYTFHFHPQHSPFPCYTHFQVPLPLLPTCSIPTLHLHLFPPPHTPTLTLSTTPLKTPNTLVHEHRGGGEEDHPDNEPSVLHGHYTVVMNPVLYILP